MMHVVRAWTPAVLYMALIWVVSAMHIDTAAIEFFPLKDKGIHLVEYTALGFLVAYACVRTFISRGVFRALAVAVLITIAWGVSDETHQAYVPGREADPIDLVADTFGALFGACIMYALWRRTHRRAAIDHEGNA